MRKQIVLAAAGATAAALLSACSGTTPATGSEDPAVLVEAVPSLPTAFAYDAGAFDYAGFEFQVNTQAQLVRNPYEEVGDGVRQQDLFTFEGELAESYDVSDDGLTYTFHLREGVQSVAGNQLTADDVIWSYERKWGGESVAPFINYPAIVDPVRQMKKVDDMTVSITLDRAGDGITLLSLLANVSADIYDSTLLKEHVTPEDPHAIAWSAENGNYGFGAYEMTSFTPGEKLVLEANPNYWEGEPEVKKIVQRVVEDPGMRASLLRNGDVDVAVQLRPTDIAELESTEGVKTFDGVDSVNYTRLKMNVLEAPFDDLRVRQALRLAIPYDEIITDVYRDRAVPMKGFINPNYPGADDTGLDQGTYDPAAAKALLVEAGLDTVPFDLLVSNAVPDLQEVAVQMASYAADAGFDISVVNQSSAAVSEATGTGNFQAYLQRDQAISQAPPYELMLEFTKDSPLNATGWTDQSFYDAVDRGIAAGDALSEAAGREWLAAQLIWQQQLPMITVAFVQPLVAFADEVDGFANRTEGTLDFAHIAKSD
ncbi:ABC transporter substrate-binding protein [Nocardioides carbamazepini]|uniref:ABC transporter substrate-binding protein n=1 Tax=Nocardioides carbamazepini TaxID=2854259 RepID=UPI00214A7389|nr:ABC transporter substrate-binding protein [Nocardioides carbamazepini]MCR1785844.1 ABC transporter substrate-binding protein [Nocardioides carbamazepini]